MLQVLEEEGLTELAFLAVTKPGRTGTWEDRAQGFEAVTFPVMIDTKGVFYIYGVGTYEVVLVDKQGRLVTKAQFSSSAVEQLNQRIRQLHAE